MIDEIICLDVSHEETDLELFSPTTELTELFKISCNEIFSMLKRTRGMLNRLSEMPFWVGTSGSWILCVQRMLQLTPTLPEMCAAVRVRSAMMLLVHVTGKNIVRESFERLCEVNE